MLCFCESKFHRLNDSFFNVSQYFTKKTKIFSFLLLALIYMYFNPNLSSIEKPCMSCRIDSEKIRTRRKGRNLGPHLKIFPYFKFSPNFSVLEFSEKCGKTQSKQNKKVKSFVRIQFLHVGITMRIKFQAKCILIYMENRVWINRKKHYHKR